MPLNKTPNSVQLQIVTFTQNYGHLPLVYNMGKILDLNKSQLWRLLSNKYDLKIAIPSQAEKPEKEVPQANLEMAENIKLLQHYLKVV